MTDEIFKAKIFLVIEILYNLSAEKLSLNDIMGEINARIEKRTFFYALSRDELKEIIDTFYSGQLLTEYIASDLTLSGSAFSYQLTSKGVEKYFKYKHNMERNAEVRAYNEQFVKNEKKKEKKNRMLLIGFGVCSILAVIIMVIVGISLG